MHSDEDDPGGDTALFQAFRGAADQARAGSGRLRAVSRLTGPGVYSVIVELLPQ